MFNMANELVYREIVSRNFSAVRFLQRKVGKITIEMFRDYMDFCRSTADKNIRDLKEIGAVSKSLDLVINGNFATFMGISVSYEEIEISIIGLDGNLIPWSEVNQCDELKDFTGKIEFDYTVDSLVKASTLINQIIENTKKIMKLKAVCFAFDDVDLENNEFCLSNYFSKNENSYNLTNFCRAFVNALTEQSIVVYLESNTVCRLMEEEIPLEKKKGNRVFIDLQRNGCFAAMIVNNKITYGYSLRSLNISKILSHEEKENLERGLVDYTEIYELSAKLTNPFVVVINPESISISGSIVARNSKVVDFILFQKAELMKKCGAREYRLNVTVNSNPSYSKGAAISGMYKYYNWDGTCL